MQLQNKNIGIWGFGSVGKSALSFLSDLGNTCQIMDNRTLNDNETELINSYNASFLSQNSIEAFFNNNDYILASPGIDITQYKTKATFICELDIFCQFWHKPIIAITGTVGKTTITTILGDLLNKKMDALVGGNIGTPMLDLIHKQKKADLIVLELSSWQLEHVQQFKPDIALITNIYPNHLDRHITIQHYIQAKLNICINQTEQQVTILPSVLKSTIKQYGTQSKKIWISDKTDNKIDTIKLPTCTFAQNWFFIIEVLKQLNLPISLIDNYKIQIEHRLEYINTWNEISFYNDSKSTTPASTLAALQQFDPTKTILFLGGLSKGIDRSFFIKQLPRKLCYVICFGQESEHLKQLCNLNNIPSTAYDNLNFAFKHSISIAKPGNIILFSPAGSSFDLYENYQKRGNHFKQLVTYPYE
ncbi:MAG: UDP-N-acetylmuramoyl-L-alanine--D-glutamate ligase [Candidatus Dependentiae bacterium]